MSTAYSAFNQNTGSFPDLHIHWWDLLYFRSYQGPGLSRIIYYATFVAALAVLIGELVVGTKAAGAGGFFLGLLNGLIYGFFLIAGTRLALEVALSVFSIRHSLEIVSAHYSADTSARPVSISSPAPTYQGGASYNSTVQSQSPSVFEPQYQGYQSQE